MTDDISELQAAYNEAYGYLHLKATVQSVPFYKQELRQAYNENNIDRLREVYEKIQRETYDRTHEVWNDDGTIQEKIITQSMETRALENIKNNILKTLGCPVSEISDILATITTYNQADAVLACIESSEWITSLDKDSPTDRSKGKYPYKKQLKLNRRILEQQLRDMGVGFRKAQKISQILESI